MNETINTMIKEQFGTGGISEKVWLVMTDDMNNRRCRKIISANMQKGESNE